MRGGTVSQALLDLTGCPTISYFLEDEHIVKFIKNGHFWTLLEHFQQIGYLVAFESEPIERWTTCEDVNGFDKKKTEKTV